MAAGDQPPRLRLVRFWRKLGPGLITGASDNDPSGITTYSVAGASTGYRLLWMAVATLPLLVAVQSMAARIGAVKEEGLGKVVEARYGRPVLVGSVVVLLVANVVTISADLAGIAAGVHLLVPVPRTLVIPAVGLALLAVELFWSYRRFAAVLKWLTLVLVLYVLAGFAARPDWVQVLRATVVPHLTFSKDELSSAVAILGTTISPYMFFWISSQEAEEGAATGHQGVDGGAERTRRIDVVTGMAYANLVFYFIVLANAATLGARHVGIETAAQAAEALTPIVGPADTLLFAVGLVAAGMIAVPVLAASAAYPVAELFGWKEGLDNRVRRAPGFYAVVVAAVGLGMAGDFLGVNPVEALVYAAVLQGFLAPVLLVLLTLVARDGTVMGPHRNRAFDTVFGFAAAAVMAAAAVALVVVWLTG